jgi:hypothetical protein
MISFLILSFLAFDMMAVNVLFNSDAISSFFVFGYNIMWTEFEIDLLIHIVKIILLIYVI